MVCRLQGSGGDAALAVAGTIDRLHFYKTSAVKLSIGCTITEKAPTIVLNVKALVGAFNQEKALEGAFSVIVKTGCGTDGSICGTNPVSH